MKLELKREKDVQILQVSGPLTVENCKVLRAGITKFFKDGRNKVVLELVGANDIPSDVLHELGTLNLLAGELSGKIVLAGVDPATRSRIESVSKPPVVTCYTTLAEAVDSYADPKSAPAPAAPIQPLPPPATAAPVPKQPLPPPATAAASPKQPLPPPPVAAAIPKQPLPPPPSGAALEPPKEEELKAIKEQFRHREVNELGALRKQIESITAENNTLKEQLLAMIVARRTPADTSALEAKIKALELQLEEFLTIPKDDQKKSARL